MGNTAKFTVINVGVMEIKKPVIFEVTGQKVEKSLILFRLKSKITYKIFPYKNRF